ncbi:hypothetical protein QC823_07635 [Halomonas vilamensis]|uniref:Uncharacterized protein n=1 Tax=Vreelandella vilamensis TaxID=531309 RepID=A0ABU1H5R1_9GAMM|nr:hypothetical protein [Halomonas vilamensis]MDR5898858.1 hypothetical protein [Halomonas vilamensis]
MIKLPIAQYQEAEIQEYEPASFIAAVVAPLLSALCLHGGCVEAI